VAAHRPLHRFALSALVCATLAAPASADTLYWWTNAEGGIEIGETPPPGVTAVPWDPGAPPPAAPAAPAPDASKPRGTQPKPSAPRHAAKPAPARAADDDCSRHLDNANAVREARRRVSNLESKIERLENSDVSHSFTRCREDKWNPGCDRGDFNRDAELERAREELAQAEDGLTDAEARARDAGMPRECLPD
jgi:hypothetical protein